MSIYLNAIVMLAMTLGGFIALAKLTQAIRSRRVGASWLTGRAGRPPAIPSRLAVEQTCMVDGKRRLVLVRCDGEHVLLLTGGTTDLILPLSRAPRAMGAEA